MTLDAVENIFIPADQVHLIDGQHHVPSSQHRRNTAMPIGLREQALAGASTSNTAASAVEAPVAILRVYCSCPGVSATMKRRLEVEKTDRQHRW